MNNLIENNLIRFTNISRKKDAIYANFRVKGIRNGVIFSASIAVDITALDLHPGDPLEKIIEVCGRHGLKEFKKAEFQWDKSVPVSDSILDSRLGVAQLG